VKKLFAVLCMFIVVVILSACERPATLSTWAPLDTPQAQPSAAQSVTAISVTATLSPSTTPIRAITPTPVAVVTLDVSTLANKYPLAFKGYELLTWQKNGQWVFTLMAGTNRQKSFDEILVAENTYTSTEIVKVTVIGEEEFKKLLAHLPKSEWITWGGMDLAGEVPAGTVYFSYPPDKMVNELVAYCKTLGITLLTLKKD
jgi:hypothetical protein